MHDKLVILTTRTTGERSQNYNRKKIIMEAATMDNTMTLEQKLAAINAAMLEGVQEFNKKNGRAIDAPFDPQDENQCEGCQ